MLTVKKGTDDGVFIKYRTPVIRKPLKGKTNSFRI